jgi:hypothetical protein
LGFAGTIPDNFDPAPLSAMAMPLDLASGSSSAGGAATDTPSSLKEGAGTRPFQVGVGVKISSLGLGLETATSLAPHFNVRAGFNGFNFSPNITSNGIKYAGTLAFRSGEAHLDWFPFKNGFHISPGLLYNDNAMSANASVPAGQTFTLNHVSYISTAGAVSGTGSLHFNKFDPSLLLGWGNLVPRRKHFSISVEAGAAYQGIPRTTLGLAGNVCDLGGANCRSIASDPTVQSNVLAE